MIFLITSETSHPSFSLFTTSHIELAGEGGGVGGGEGMGAPDSEEMKHFFFWLCLIPQK